MFSGTKANCDSLSPWSHLDAGPRNGNSGHNTLNPKRFIRVFETVCLNTLTIRLSVLKWLLYHCFTDFVQPFSSRLFW